MAKEEKSRSKIWNIKYFSLVLAVLFFFLFLGLNKGTSIFDHMELKLLDLHFNLKTVFEQSRIQEGVTIEKRNPNISPDILILGIDFNSLNTFGRWPFPRYRHANLMDSFSRIKNQNERESALFIDIFFIEPDNNAYDDAILTEAMSNNGRVFIETVLKRTPMNESDAEEYFGRQKELYNNFGEITNITGDVTKVTEYFGAQSPLKPYGRAAFGYGHANFYEDYDKRYRRQQLIAKSSVLLETINVDELTPGYAIDTAVFERLAWLDTDGISHTLPYPLTDKILDQLKKDLAESSVPRVEDSDGDGTPDKEYYTVNHYRDHFVPAITLSLWQRIILGRVCLILKLYWANIF